MSKLTKALTAAAGNAGESLYVEDVFSTYLYEGNGATQTITNGIDLDGEGGLVWIKNRGAATTDHRLFDTNRGIYKSVSSNLTDAEDTSTSSLTAFNSSGFSLSGFNAEINDTGNTYASWTFRKAEKFFDVVTYTGDGVSGRTVAHNLGSVPACIIVKNISLSGYNWQVYHTSTGNTDYLNLNDADATASFIGAWNNTSPTSTHFTLGNWAQTNDAAGSTYVAYLFASDAGGFGDDGSESIIKCGSFTVPASSPYDTEVNLGFEPQWLLIKGASNSENWDIHDNMRGIAAGSNDNVLYANHASSEITGYDELTLTPTGFIANPNGLSPSATYIYIAIRRPMKTPESGTEVFDVTEQADGTPAIAAFSIPFNSDLGIHKEVDDAADNFHWFNRLTGSQHFLRSNGTNAEFDTTVSNGYAFNDLSNSVQNNYIGGGPRIFYNFKRATGFFDVVAYTGTAADGTQSTTLNHNLAATPELMICKRRNGANGWISYHKDLNGGVNPQEYYIYLDRTQGSGGPDSIAWGTSTGGGVAPTSTEFTVGAYNDNGSSGNTYIAYLFATLAGVSKVGSYTGTGSNVNVDCGFSAGARFILIKRTDSTGDWYVWDSVRGIVAGNDPYLLLNSTAAEVTSTDYIDPLASGFTVTSSAPAGLNASGGSYIFLAIS